MTDDQIQAAAMAAGFTLKPQPDGSHALHPHVFEFGRAMFAAGQQAAQDQIADLCRQLEQCSERFQRAQLAASHWQQRAELAERHRIQWMSLAGACLDCGGSGIVGVLPLDDSPIHYKFCMRCAGSGKEPA